MIKTKCLGCGGELQVGGPREGDGYFFGYDTDYYGMGFDDEQDPHRVIGHYCRECGERLEKEAKVIGWERIS